MSTYLTLTGRVIVVLFDVADMVPLSWDNWINATVSAKFEYYKTKVATRNPDPVSNGVAGYQVMSRPDGQGVVMRVGSGTKC